MTEAWAESFAERLDDTYAASADYEALLQILHSAGDGGTFVEMCAGDFDRPTMVNADQTGLPDALLAWRDAAVRTAVARLGLHDEYGILDHGGGLLQANNKPKPLSAGSAALRIELRATGFFAPGSQRPASLMRRKVTGWEEIPEDVTPDDIMPGYSEHKADAAREAGS